MSKRCTVCDICGGDCHSGDMYHILSCGTGYVYNRVWLLFYFYRKVVLSLTSSAGNKGELTMANMCWDSFALPPGDNSS